MKRMSLPIIVVALFALGATAAEEGFCPGRDYKKFLAWQRYAGPTELTTQTVIPSADGSFDLVYEVAGMGPDVLAVQVTCRSVGKSPGPLAFTGLNENTQILRAPFTEPRSIRYGGLLKDRLYSVTLSVVTDYAAISMEGITAPRLNKNWPPQTIPLATAYFYWDAATGGHVSMQKKFDGPKKESSLWVTFGGAMPPGGRRLTLTYEDSTIITIWGPAQDDHAHFSSKSVQGWFPEMLSKLSIAGIGAEGETISQVDIPLSEKPCAFCEPLPCEYAMVQEGRTETIELPDVTLETSGVLAGIKAGISANFGGALAGLKLRAQQNSYSVQLVNGTDAGLLCQNALTRVNHHWDTYDGAADIRECWEFDPETCQSDPEPNNCVGSEVWRWNPTQGGTYKADNPPQETCGGRNDDWDGEYQPLGQGEDAIAAVDPFHVSDNDNSSEVRYVSRFMHWTPPPSAQSPDIPIQGLGWMDATVYLAGGATLHLAPAIACATRHLLQADDDSAINFQAVLQDWVFFGSQYVTKSYMFDENWAQDDCYGLREVVPCSQQGAPQGKCLEPFGDDDNVNKWWRTQMESNPSTYGHWAPYALMKTNGDVWILIYNANDVADEIQMRRMLRWDSYGDVTGHVTSPLTLFTNDGIDEGDDGLTGDHWSRYLYTLIIVGDSEHKVMCRLRDYTCGAYPYINPNPPTGCTGCPDYDPCN